jgi:hypothetical protein
MTDGISLPSVGITFGFEDTLREYQNEGRCVLYLPIKNNFLKSKLFQRNIFSHMETKLHIKIKRSAASISPNIIVEWLALLLRIREAPGSILGPCDRLS